MESGSSSSHMRYALFFMNINFARDVFIIRTMVAIPCLNYSASESDTSSAIAIPWGPPAKTSNLLM